jgi:hypothetical protein
MNGEELDELYYILSELLYSWETNTKKSDISEELFDKLNTTIIKIDKIVPEGYKMLYAKSRRWSPDDRTK